MTIQRQYNLPNCTLILQGMGEVGGNGAETRPAMSMLINAECHLAGQEPPISGGREFLESLVTAVTEYAQELLSGVHRLRRSTVTQWVQLEQINANQHRMRICSPDLPPGSGIEAQLSREIDLTTVQLFDLVEAVDQFFADSQTLPDLALKLASVPKRSVHRDAAIAKQAVPATIGLSSLALAAIAFFFVPIPQVQQPADLVPKPSSENPANTPQKTPGASPPTGSPTATPPTVDPSANPTASPSSTPTLAPSPTPTVSPQSNLNQSESLLTTAPEITAPAQLEALGNQLKTKVEQAWTTRTGLAEDLVYRVGVAKDGAIVGYDPVNDAAQANVKQTPLLDLLYLPPGGTPSSSEPIAQFKLLFTSSGVVGVAPWQSVAAVIPANKGLEITATRPLEEILPKLRRQITNEWQPEKQPPLSQDLVYRVRVKADGTIVDYKPDNQPAKDYAQTTPLPKFGKLADDTAAPMQESFALFKVVFKPKGTLELTPWRGWQS
jgi:hypothetical protein